MNSRFTRKRRGGAFVAKGSYGCVFKKPPLKCVNEASRRNNSYISKLSSHTTAEEEYEQSRVIRYYDPTEKYFVTAESECNLNSTNVNPENRLNKCDLDDIKAAMRTNDYSNTGLVLYKNAGADLHRLTLNVEDYSPFYESMTNIFHALKFIHSKGILHRDLKSDNLISQKNPDGSFTTRLIDVGFMCSLKPLEGEHTEELNTLQRKFARLCEFTYVRTKARTYGPFYEFVFGIPGRGKANRIQEYQDGGDFSSVYEAWVNDVSKYLGSDDPFKKEDGTPAHKYSDVMDALVEVWRGHETKHFSPLNNAASTGSDFVLTLASKVDIFCFGMVLAKLQHRYVSHTVERKGGALKTFVPRSTKLKNAGAPDIWVGVDELERFGVSAQEAAWHVAVGNRISIPLHILMTRMSNLDPSRAINLTDALRDYTEILTAVRELYTPVKVYKGLKAVDEDNDIALPVEGISKKASSAKASSKAATPKPVAPTSTRKLKLNDASQKALAKKKRALEKARKAAKEEIEEAQEELSDARKKHRELEDKLDKAKRDKMAVKVIADFEKALAKYTTIIQKAVVQLEEAREEGRDAVNAAQAAYVAFRDGLPRRTAST